MEEDIHAAGHAGGHDCQHWPPYADTRRPTDKDFTSKRTDGTTDFYPEGVKYYSWLCKCHKPCSYTRMMVSSYLPWTRFLLANGEIFKFGHSMWTNPAVARTPADCISVARGNTAKVARGDTTSEGQVNSAWHKFWYAVHHLGRHVSGTQPATQEQEDQWIEWLIVKLQPTKENFDSVKETFKKAGLLEEGGPGDGEAGVRAKFLLAEEMIKHHDLSSAPKLVKRQGSAGEEEEGASRAQPPPKRARTHFRDDPTQEGGAAGGSSEDGHAEARVASIIMNDMLDAENATQQPTGKSVNKINRVSAATGGHAQLVVHGYGGSSESLVFDESAVLILLYLASLYY
jgi:hypothetical protein